LRKIQTPTGGKKHRWLKKQVIVTLFIQKSKSHKWSELRRCYKGRVCCEWVRFHSRMDLHLGKGQLSISSPVREGDRMAVFCEGRVWQQTHFPRQWHCTSGPAVQTWLKRTKVCLHLA
jgi:hypothetical protein